MFSDDGQRHAESTGALQDTGSVPLSESRQVVSLVQHQAVLADRFNPKGKTVMKTSILVGAIVACALSAPIVSAQEKSAPGKPAMSMDMDKQMPQMQENMKKMQQQMDKLRATTDPKERQKLMREHMQTMQENMKAMRAMGGPMMMGGQKGGGMMMGGKKEAMTEGDMMKRHEMMEKRMDMMQMMMEQMMQHDQMMESMPAR